MLLFDLMTNLAPLFALTILVVVKLKTKTSCAQLKPAEDPRLGRLGLPKKAVYKPKLTGWDAVMDSFNVIESQLKEQDRRLAETKARLDKFK